MKMSNKKAMYFTLDALIFATIIVLSAMLIVNVPEPINHDTAKYYSQDVIHIMEELTVAEFDLSWAQNISDENISVMEGIAELWTKGNTTLANGLAEQFLDTIPSRYYSGMWIDKDLVAADTTPPTKQYISTWRIVSGIEKNKPIKGFIARAEAKSIIKNSTQIISISPEGSGWDAGYVDITKSFNTTGLTINNATLVLSVHADQSNSDVTADIGSCSFTRNDFTWLFPSEEGNIGTISVTGCIPEGIVNLSLYLNNNGYNAHTHPGMYVQIDYTASDALETKTTTISKRFFFDNVRSVEQSGDSCGAWSTVPVFIPEGATNISSYVQIAGNNIRDYTGNNWFRAWDGSWQRERNYDYLFFVNSNTPFDTDDHPNVNEIYTYNSSQITPELFTGTNLFAAYFNNYGDYSWGEDWVEIYSNQFDDPLDSSFIEVNYTLPTASSYGLIDVSSIDYFTGAADNDKTHSFTYPTQTQEKGDAFVHIAQQYSYFVTVWADTFNPPNTQIFRSPSARAIPTTIYMDNSYFSITPTVDNYVRVRDDNSGNHIIPEVSFIEYHSLIPSFVGYESVFDTANEAETDALARLEVLGTGFISFADIETSSNTITGVPSLWGPALIEVRVWG